MTKISLKENPIVFALPASGKSYFIDHHRSFSFWEPSWKFEITPTIASARWKEMKIFAKQGFVLSALPHNLLEEIQKDGRKFYYILPSDSEEMEKEYKRRFLERGDLGGANTVKRNFGGLRSHLERAREIPNLEVILIEDPNVFLSDILTI